MNDISRVVVITADEEIIPLCPIFFAIMKDELVVPLPSIIRAATSFSFLKSIFIANGKNKMQKRKSLLKLTSIMGLAFSFTFLNSKLAPRAMSAIGEATFPR